MTNLSLFPVERNRYFYGKLLTARDFELEQKYMNDKRRLLNLALTGAGVVCGLSVNKSDDLTLMVESGLALDYQGREIVVDAPIIKKLQMLEGFSGILGKREAFLCLRYREEPAEKVNAVGSQGGGHVQYNKVLEGYSLTLETGEPEIAAVFDAGGLTHTGLVYSANGVRVALSFPVCVLSGEEFTAECILMREAGGAPLSLSLEFPSQACALGEDGDAVRFEFTENALEQKSLYRRRFKLRACTLTRMTLPVCSGRGTLRLQMGEWRDEAGFELDGGVYIAAGRQEAGDYLSQRDTLLRRLEQSDLPIYLARLDLVPAGPSSIIGGITPLPLGQRLRRPPDAADASGRGVERVGSEVRTLKYWQKPEVGVSYNHATGSLNFQFGIPTAQAYDYDTASGVVEIPLSGGMRVNARYFSEETPHNLGPGNVEIRVALEFPEDGQPRLFFGNGEVFRAKNGDRNVPQAQAGVILYPEKGTFRVGVWLQDTVPGSVLRVRYFASKAARDMENLKLQARVTVRVVPEVSRVRPRERLRLKAVVSGCEDRRVNWALKDQDGGSVDQNGLYQAPDAAGTFEVTARSAADPEAVASAFLIVED